MNRFTKAALAAVFTLASLTGPAALAQAAPPAPGTFTHTVDLTFAAATDTFSFDVEAAQGAGTLTVATTDCCIAGDLWASFAEHGQPGGADEAIGVGGGSITEVSGAASVKGWHSGTVTISYDSGVDVFPAGMSVTFTYAPEGQGQAKGNTGMVVTPLLP